MAVGSFALYVIIAAALSDLYSSLPVNEAITDTTGGSFEGFQVLEITEVDRDETTKLMWQLENEFKVDIWGRPSRGKIDVMVGPNHLNDVTKILTSGNVPFVVKIKDVQRLLNVQFNDLERARHRRSLSLSSVSKEYLRFGEVSCLLSPRNICDLESKSRPVQLTRMLHYPVWAEHLKGGQLLTLRFVARIPSRPTKSAIIFDAGIHAREWIAPAMALNIIFNLAFNPYNDSEVNELLEKFDWIIIPVLNPDGYVYSHISSSTRLWRKTRTTSYSDHPGCFGVDANRNFGYHWTNDSRNYDGMVSVSSDPCDITFSGPWGFSEPETRNLRALLHRERHRTAAYMSLHSFGQLFIYPWGYDSTASLVDENDLNMIGREFAEVMKLRFRQYDVGGAAATIVYKSPGSSLDYARGGTGIKYAFVVELPPGQRDGYGDNGFILPASQIQVVVNDHWPAFKKMALALWNKISQSGIQVVPDANFVDDDEVDDDGFYTYNDSAGDADDISEEKTIKEQQPQEPSDY